MAGHRYRSPGSSRGSSRKKRRYHYEEKFEAEKDSDLDSRSSISSNRSSGTCVPVLASSSTSSSTRHRHANDSHDHDADSRHSHSSHRHRKYRRSHHHHQRKALPAPDEEDEKIGVYPTTVAIREEYPVQRIPHSRQRDLSPDEEEVYDHRPRPLSRRHGSSHPERRRGQSESQGVNNEDRNFFVAAAMVLVGLFICMGEAD